MLTLGPQGGYPLGAPGTTARVTDPAVAQQIIDRVIAHGQIGIDSSRFYSQGTSEEVRSNMANLLRVSFLTVPADVASWHPGP